MSAFSIVLGNAFGGQGAGSSRLPINKRCHCNNWLYTEDNLLFHPRAGLKGIAETFLPTVSQWYYQENSTNQNSSRPQRELCFVCRHPLDCFAKKKTSTASRAFDWSPSSLMTSHPLFPEGAVGAYTPRQNSKFNIHVAHVLFSLQLVC